MSKNKVKKRRDILSPQTKERQNLECNKTYFSPISKNSNCLSPKITTLDPNNYFTSPDASTRPSPQVKIFSFEGLRNSKATRFRSPQPNDSFIIPKITSNFKLRSKESPRMLFKFNPTVLRKESRKKDNSMNTSKIFKKMRFQSRKGKRKQSKQIAKV